MDSQAVWENLLDAFADGDWEAATEHAEALLTWIERGGFPPQTVERRQLRQEVNRAIAIAACQLAIEKTRQPGGA